MFRSSAEALLLVPVVCFTVVKSSIGSISIVPSVPSFREFQGGLVLGDSLGRDAQVKGDSISLTAINGNVGTAEAPLLVDTNPDENGNPGILNAAANNGGVFITEISGDMTIGSITSTGKENSVSLKTEDGSIVESDKGSNDLIRDAVDAAIEAAKAALADGSLKVFDISTFTVGGEALESYMADVDTDPAYTPDTEAVVDGYFHESEFRSAPYFDVQIDGITLLDTAF